MFERLGNALSRLNPFGSSAPVVAVLRLSGVIGGRDLLGGRLTLAAVAGAIEQAFKTSGLKAVALAINSPGGSPVQSAFIYKRIRALATEKMVKVYAFCEDVAASGGYMLALSADEIYADEGSIVGSIGVISAGFGFQDVIEKIGIERRVHATGDAKDMLDPFRPERPKDVEHLKSLQQDVLRSFTGMVKERRGTRLNGPEDKLFSGAFWAGEEALKLGLIDGLGDLRTVMRRKYGEDVKLRLIGAERSWLRRQLGSARTELPSMPSLLPDGFADDLIAAIEARSLWSRFGL
jgi:signal peptide peptidase SppA